MRLNVLAGCRELLRPGPIEAARLAALAGPEVRGVAAPWLAPRCGRFTHDFLLDEPDGRIEVFARALADNFGARLAPLVVLPELLDEAEAGRGPSLSALAAIWAGAPLDGLTLHAIALADETRPAAGWTGTGVRAAQAGAALAALASAAGRHGVPEARIETRVIPAGPETPEFELVFRNLLANRLAARLCEALAPTGLLMDPRVGAQAVQARLEAWARGGLLPDPVLEDDRFDVLATGMGLALTTGASPLSAPPPDASPLSVSRSDNG
jgi:hypothetical protein